MSASDDMPKSDHRPTGLGPGERLQAGRIQQGLSLEDVATRMHLSVSILESIEENNFEEITAPIFVKGYLRAYARIVSLDEDEMIQQYMVYYSEEDPPITSTSNMAPELSVTDARIKSTTYLVILVLGALLAVWWWNKEQNQEAPISLDTQSSTIAQETDAATETVSSEIEAASESMIESITPVEEVPVEQTPVEESAIEEPPVEEPAVDESTTAVMQKTEPEASETLQPPSQVEAYTDASGLKLTRLAPTGSDKLLVIIHADTWTDIKDGADHQMVYDLLRANQSVELTGEAPFVVFLGNGHGVEIKFNGEDVEIFTRVRDDNTARLKIGG